MTRCVVVMPFNANWRLCEWLQRNPVIRLRKTQGTPFPKLGGFNGAHLKCIYGSVAAIVEQPHLSPKLDAGGAILSTPLERPFPHCRYYAF